MHLKSSLTLFLIFLSTTTIGAFYPNITADNTDPLFKQLQIDIEENSRRILNKQPVLPIQFFEYSLKENDTIFSVSSRFNLTYESIATVNNIDNQLFFSSLDKVLIPTCHGIYSDTKINDTGVEITLFKRTIYLHPGGSFNKKDRLTFLVSPFQSPLKKPVITSGYGYRENPFTGRREFHNGLDLKASKGTKIFSPYKGVVKSVGYSENLGNYLIIEHPMGYTSHYFHLMEIKVQKNKTVGKDDYVGKTGNSGRSTGPHLHFEIRLNNETINPSLLLGNV